MKHREKGSQQSGGTETTGGLVLGAWNLSGGQLSALRSETKALELFLVAVLTLSS